ncbi:ferritin heavy chain B-like [Oppia nitens]|uniref:ferritin heavy chain B-like n=1 Tax=Oppia nitens TaxID=1686743 RepID=UPI0023DC3E6E|nr:ferritin heavy chain B-like [Oppia nitens]
MIENLVTSVKMIVKFGLLAVLAIYLSFSGTALSQSNELPVKSNRFELKSECLRELNTQINSELFASLVYMNMGAYFDNNKVARKGFAKFFADQSREEKDHAHKLMDYINKRGGIVNTLDVKMPVKSTWNSPKQALEDAIQLENDVNDYIHKIHGIAEHTCLDPHLMDFIESEYLEEQMTSINQLTRIHTILSQMQNGVGEYLLDRQLLKGDVKLDEL